MFPKSKKAKRYGCLAGCLIFFVFAYLSCWTLPSHIMRQKNRDAYEKIQRIRFSPGSQDLGALRDQDSFRTLSLDEEVSLGDSCFCRWDNGMYTAWFVGDPVKHMVVHYHFGATRLNHHTSEEMGSDYPDQAELEEVISTIEGHSRRAGEYAQHILYSLQWMRVGSKGSGTPGRRQ